MLRKYGLLLLICLLSALLCPVFAAPPQKLAFASDRSGHGDIFIRNAWGQLTNLTRSPTGDWDPQWSPDGRRLAFTSYLNGQADIRLMAPDGSGATNLTADPAWDYSPAWSPDGARLVFVSERDGDAELFIQAVTETTATQITFNTHQDRLPDWGAQIVFAAVVDGAEQIYRLDPNHANAITPLLEAGLNGTNPVWRPNRNEIAFVGRQDSEQISLYLLDLATRKHQTLYTSPTWIGSLSWSADGQWLFFTARPNANHDLMALDVATGTTVRLTNHPAWDDFPALSPDSAFSLQVAAADNPPPVVDNAFGYGVNLADLSNAYLVQDIHFNAIKGYVNWATIETAPGEFRWVDPDNVLRAAEDAGAGVLLRVHGTPDWARPAHTPISHPPANPADFARFMTALAVRYRGRVAAYEIWNEPNLNYEWGNRPPDPVEYTTLLKTAYQAVKTQDPAAKVISAGPAPTGNGRPPDSLGDLAFIEGMYRAGAKGYFDALGSHIYAGNLSPEGDDPRTDINFARILQQRQLMLEHEDSATPMWITEMGWSLQTHWDLGQYHNQGVSALEQAQYLTGAYRKIRADWPWVQAAYLFNLDFSRAPWYPAAEQMRWYAILNPDRTPRPAYTDLGWYRTDRRQAE